MHHNDDNNPTLKAAHDIAYSARTNQMPRSLAFGSSLIVRSFEGWTQDKKGEIEHGYLERTNSIRDGFQQRQL